MRHLLLASVHVALCLACGGTSPPTGLAPAAGATGDGGTNSLGGAGGSDAHPDAGNVDAGTNRFGCGNALPLISATTGFERCEAGYVRRVHAGSCPSSVPRPNAVVNYDSSIDECEYDADCAALEQGHCAPREGGSARTCVVGCLSDDQCGSGRICACDDPVGRCVPASCSSSSDCNPGFDCASYTSLPNCFATGFACQTPADGCVGDGQPECDGRFVNATFCVFQSGNRQCSTLQCTTP
jgi:hypothetical protein